MGLYDGMRYETMADNSTGASGTVPIARMSLQFSWERRRAHTASGADVLGCIDLKPCEKISVRCPEEVQYQILVADISAMMEQARKLW